MAYPDLPIYYLTQIYMEKSAGTSGMSLSEIPPKQFEGRRSARERRALETMFKEHRDAINAMAKIQEGGQDA